MELNDLIFLGACAILGNTYFKNHSENDREMAVKDAKLVWEEVLRQDREER
jgi:hypothetical protein